MKPSPVSLCLFPFFVPHSHSLFFFCLQEVRTNGRNVEGMMQKIACYFQLYHLFASFLWSYTKSSNLLCLIFIFSNNCVCVCGYWPTFLYLLEFRICSICVSRKDICLQCSVLWIASKWISVKFYLIILHTVIHFLWAYSYS